MAGNSEKGFVLITVIWLLILIALLSASFVYVTNLNARSKSNIIASFQAESVADGLVRLVAMTLWNQIGAGATEIPVDGTPFSCPFQAGRQARFSVQDVRGLVDINAATGPTLASLFSARGIDRQRIPALIDALLDFRDADDSRRMAGAEKSDYERLGLRPGPNNALFKSIEELDQVLGYDSALLDRIIKYVTVHKKRDGIDRHVAPAALLAGFENSGTSTRRRDRTAARERKQAAGPGRSGVFIITTDVRTENGGRFARHAIVRLMGKDKRRPYEILTWKRVWPGNPLSIAEQAADGAVSAYPCPFRASSLRLPHGSRLPIDADTGNS